jgi:hypothetical protein
MVKAAEVRFYVDADILGLGKLLCSVRNDVTYPGFAGGDKMFGRIRPACPITSTEVSDQVWIPETARYGWVILTRDSAIQDNAAEIAAVRDSGARMVALVGRDAGNTWDQLHVVMRRWERIEQSLTEPGPFIYALGKASFRRVDLG